MKIKKYVYFVSYIFSKNNQTGYGNISIKVNHRINDAKTITDIVQQLMMELNTSNVIILNYKFLKIEKEKI